MADGRQPPVGVVLPQHQAVLAAGGHDAVGLLGALGDEVVDEGADVALGALEDEVPLAPELPRGVDPRREALDGGLLIAGGAVELPRPVEAGDLPVLQGGLQSLGVDAVILDGVGGPGHLRPPQARDAVEHVPLDILGKGRGEPLDVELLGLQAHGLHEDLVAELLREADDLGLKAGAVPGADPLDGAVVEGGAVQVLLHDALGFLRGPGEPADGTVLRRRLGPIGEGQGLFVPLLPLHLVKIHRPGVDPGRRPGLEAPQGQSQSEQALRQAVRRVQPVRAGGLHAVPHDGPAGEVRPRGQDHGPHPADRPGGEDYFGDVPVLHPDVHHLPLADVKVLLPLQGALHVLLIAAAVRLGPEAPDGGALAPVQKAVLDAAGIRRPAHLAPQGVQLPDQVALAGAADGGVAGHVAHGV